MASVLIDGVRTDGGRYDISSALDDKGTQFYDRETQRLTKPTASAWDARAFAGPLVPAARLRQGVSPPVPLIKWRWLGGNFIIGLRDSGLSPLTYREGITSQFPPPALTRSYEALDYAFQCLPSGFVIYRSGVEEAGAGDIVRATSTDDVFSVTYEQDGVVRFYKNDVLRYSRSDPTKLWYFTSSVDFQGSECELL